ncbi:MULTISPECIES: winged helix-turn-helix transcriptional regulator [unclassified Sphingobium]|uniref:winged helix-turn-helix transcriptional regulator n=1 Tax=unclassified Sphingobium TaxID=2611147 RepID=UPI0022259F5B|nr:MULTISPECIES: helix-turn-helix domain-containing protein [unclassified Sphingobium]MCW2382574.1 DNA-binding HxlR family transcriptional regulator [Sphingobium sp. B2D3B]MCW2397253.1 DNA-binding HxlR family transcriptional regulator [Sphingobium sp. B2D3C]
MAERKGLDAFEGCALPAALETMGERWSFMILRACFSGIVYFEDFQCALGIARNILSNRLGKLVARGILTREPVANDKRRVAYCLTEKGKALMPVMIALRQWGERWEPVPPARRILADSRDRQPVREVRLQAADGRLLDYQDLCWIEAPAAADEEPDCTAAPLRAMGAPR